MKDLNVNMNAGGKRQQMRLKVNNKVNANNLMKQRSGGSISRRAQTQNLGNITGDFKTQVSRLMGGSGKVKTLPLVAAIRQLSVMTNAGISIHDSIKEVARATEDKTLKGIFSAMNDDLNAGLSLTESAEKFRPQLGDVVVAMVSLGEATGNMAESLAKLASMLTELYENQRKFKKAMRYPMTLMIVMAIAFTILMMYVVPKFREIFEELGADLPLPTKILLGIESALSNYGGYILLGIIVTIVGLKWLYKNNDQFKIGWDRGILKVYLFGKIIFYSTMSRFMLIFTELVRAGIPIADALDTAVLMVDNHMLKEKLSSVKIAVQQGVSLTEAFENTGLYESMLIQMISAGEQAGNLDKMLGNVADYYKEKFDDIIDNISSYVEPIMLFFMAGMVLLLALGIFMPMWDLGKAVKS
ncbi:type II secretion system F family protein [Campylobacter sp. VBCF_06 NA8]|uniref:type II secretion system F family protein n=1 Tax=Campylobacter sp. VBCF_06 NA8 TaxID=2983822 RepID=UPI0022E9CC0E|nr:type II secretion system F family protein [Campylobacter sp. VBCF_06 NA8]MDA3046381.1 type II secretion system F family protein [Campylobacter sp. VBCF_06 NA8]